MVKPIYQNNGLDYDKLTYSANVSVQLKPTFERIELSRTKPIVIAIGFKLRKPIIKINGLFRVKPTIRLIVMGWH